MKNHRCCSRLGIFLLLFLIAAPSQATILINEILTATEEENSQGNTLEWIELFNSGDQQINLNGYTITDDVNEPEKWAFPSVSISPREYLLLYATGEDRNSPNNLHVNFQLQREGEAVVLFRADGMVEDFIQYPTQRREVSYGRSPNDSETWLFYESPTPGEENKSDGALGIAAKPEFSEEAGIKTNPFELTLIGTNGESSIRYTLDGSEPARSSRLYDGSISINETTVIRARTFRDDYLPSDAATHTYLYQDEHPLPVMMISTHPDNLFDRRIGIYANATSHGREWERPASFEYFLKDGSRLFGVDAGLRIHGGASRKRSDKKSFRLYFRDEYGPRMLNAKILPDTEVRTFDKLVLRAGYNDSWSHWDFDERRVAVYFSDEMARQVHQDMGSVVANGTFAELYLNGEFWGLYNIVERIDEDFMASYYEYGEELWDVVSDDEIKDGKGQAWNNLKSFVSRSNFRDPDVYKEFQTMVDLEQMTSYYILNIYVQNHDWPHHNWYAGRPRVPEGQWRFCAWDTEDSFGSGASRGSYNKNTFNRAQDPGTGFLGQMFNKMLRNDEYQQYFLQELNHHFANALSKENLNQRLEENAAKIRDVMNREAGRWNQNRGVESFNAAVDIAREFIELREEIVRQHVERGLRLPTSTPTPLPPSPTPANTPIGYEPTPTPTPQQPITELGIFGEHQDIGGVSAPGDVEYNPQTNAYLVRGSGDDIWNNADEFHFLYREVTTDFTFQARMEGTNFGSSNWVKLALMARDTLEPGSKHFASRFQQSTMEASSQWRTQSHQSAGSTNQDLRIPQRMHDGRLRLVREGDVYSTLYYDIQMNEWVLIDSHEVNMLDPIYVGLAVTSHDDGSYAEGTFADVKLQLPPTAVQDWFQFIFE